MAWLCGYRLAFWRALGTWSRGRCIHFPNNFTTYNWYLFWCCRCNGLGLVCWPKYCRAWSVIHCSIYGDGCVRTYFSNTNESPVQNQSTSTPQVSSPQLANSPAAPNGIHPRRIIEYRDYKIIGQINGNFRVEEEYFKTEEAARQFIDNFYFDTSKFPSYEAASTRIEYDNHAEATWSKTQKVQSDLGVEFLRRLDVDPRLDVDALFSELISDYEKSQNPYDKPEANEALHMAAKISEEAKEEFQKVYELLGDTLNPDQILETIKTKFVIQEVEVPAETRLYRFPYDWEKRLQRAEQKGTETGMLLMLEELGYSIDTSEKRVSRPELLETSETGVFYYQTTHQLMTICNSERKFLSQVELGKV